MTFLALHFLPNVERELELLPKPEVSRNWSDLTRSSRCKMSRIPSTVVSSQRQIAQDRNPFPAAVSFFATIETETRQRHLAFLVIGGHAVNLYGFARETADLDFLVCSDDRSSWVSLFAGLGYHIFSESQNFVQLASDRDSAWPVDLMFVQPATFKPMLDGSRVVEFYGTASRIPALEHLIALKLHALKNARPHRFLKDFLDVENLIRINHLDITSENIRRLFEKYATFELYEKMSAAFGRG